MSLKSKGNLGLNIFAQLSEKIVRLKKLSEQRVKTYTNHDIQTYEYNYFKSQKT